MGLGLVGTGGVAALQEGVRRRLIDRAVAEQHAQEQAMQQQRLGLELRSADRADRSLDQNDAFRRDQQAALEEQRATANTERELAGTEKLNDAIPAGRYPATPAMTPVMGRLVKIGAATPVEERPRVDVGPLLPGDTGADLPAGFEKRASVGQQAAQDAADAKVEAARVAAETRTNENTQRAKDRIAQIQAAAASRPPAPEKLTKVEHRDPATGQTITEYLPQREVRGQKFEKGASAATETRLASAQAVNQTGDDIIAQLSDPKVAAMVGPAMGRYNSVQEFIGNPPPELAGLAGAIESYAIANMGVHGMRSSAGAEQIKKLLDKKHTPESLIATIKGLSQFSQHFMENEGRGPAKTAPAGTPKRVVYDMNGNPVK